MKILVADDSLTIRRLVSKVLAGDGHDVIEAEDGAEALELVQSARPDLIVLDKEMPNLDGFEVVQRLREREETRSLPIVMLTDWAADEEVFARLGVDEHVAKPFSPRDLLRRVQSALARLDDSRGPS